MAASTPLGAEVPALPPLVELGFPVVGDQSALDVPVLSVTIAIVCWTRSKRGLSEFQTLRVAARLAIRDARPARDGDRKGREIFTKQPCKSSFRRNRDLQNGVVSKIIDRSNFLSIYEDKMGKPENIALNRREVTDRSRDRRAMSKAMSQDEAQTIYNLPFNDLLFRAHIVHRAHFDPNSVQMSRLLSIKTGGCPEDCGYCSQSAHYPTGLQASKLVEVEKVVVEASKARQAGATRYCMGAAWRSPKDRDMDPLVAMVKGVKALGMETCMKLGMLTQAQAERLAKAGLDYYNHNIDTSERYYSEIITTRRFEDRVETLENVRMAGIKVCAGGILGMGETVDDRIAMLVTLANLPAPPESVPINHLIPIPGSKLAAAPSVDPIDFVRTIALARILMPTSHVRLSAGRTKMSDEMQALCFFAGANSIFVGGTLLTAANPGEDHDRALFRRLGLSPMPLEPAV